MVRTSREPATKLGTGPVRVNGGTQSGVGARSVGMAIKSNSQTTNSTTLYQDYPMGCNLDHIIHVG